MKTYLINGITSQLGLVMLKNLHKENKIIGITRKLTEDKESRLSSVVNLKHSNLTLIEADRLDQSFLKDLIQSVKPDIIGNLSAITRISDGELDPQKTIDVNFGIVLSFLESLRQISGQIKFFNLGTSEIFGNNHESDYENIETWIDENTRKSPRNTYGLSKLLAYEAIKSYRDIYKLYATNIISFNFESKYRQGDFLFKKISDYVKKKDFSQKLKLGNLDIKKTWTDAEDIWSAIEYSFNYSPADYCISSGNVASVKEIVKEFFLQIGIKDWENYIEICPEYFRPNITKFSIPDITKIKSTGWQAKYNLKSIIDRILNE